ncbi:Silicatein [Geodia barretti]|uniref:Silicatein n=1 Tax=Geodia barretti TaxID=519541 RepID=A0AA35SNL1_GEOBA|nr:Silicatein [Geodia barretti]
MKMLSVLVFCVLLAVVRCEVQYQHPEEWDLWKTEHGKSYESQREELERHIVWLSNREYINAHNKNSHIFGYTLAMNHLGDITEVEYEKRYMTYRRNTGQGNYTKLHNPADFSLDLPESVDWRTNNAITNIKDQVRTHPNRKLTLFLAATVLGQLTTHLKEWAEHNVHFPNRKKLVE